MNLLYYKRARITPVPAEPPPRRERIRSVWRKDAGSGRLERVWVAEQDGERSCTGRPCAA